MPDDSRCAFVRDYLNKNDRFCAFAGIRITLVKEDYAEAEAGLNEHTLNGLNVAQGGVIYTLADLSFAGAANANATGKACIGMGGNITYLRPGTGKKLRAEARMINRNRRTCLCGVDVFDDSGRRIAYGTFTGFMLEQDFGSLPQGK